MATRSRYLTFSKFPLLSGLALILGLLRELVVSSHYGLGSDLDVYVAVMGFYSFLGVQIGNVLEMAFISKSAAGLSLSELCGRLVRAMSVLMIFNFVSGWVLLAFGAELIARIFPAFSTTQIHLGDTMMLGFVPAIIAANMGGMVRASLNVRETFSPGMLWGSVISVAVIAGVWSGAAALGIHALLYGFLAGNVLAFLLMMTVFFRNIDTAVLKGWRGWFRERVERDLWSAAFVVFIGELAFMGFSLTERSLAATFGPGTVSAFFYAWALVNIPLALVVMPATSIAYPRIVRAFAQSNRKGRATVFYYSGWLLFYGLLAACALSLFSEWIVHFVFVRGRFTTEDADATAMIVRVLVFALPFMSLGRLMRYALYSLASYKTPSLALLIGWGVIVVLARELIPLYGVHGLAVASVTAVLIEPLVMMLSFFRISRRPEQPKAAT